MVTKVDNGYYIGKQQRTDVLIKTANYALQEHKDECVGVSNKGASGAITFSLLPAIPGRRVIADVDAAQELRLDPNGTETIALPSTGAQGAAGKYLTANAIGERVELYCEEARKWKCRNFIGTWTAEA